VLQASLGREYNTIHELLAALRRNGLAEPQQVRFVVLEENGVVPVRDGEGTS
jgi:uncharacterized membrane protein YcaP (DUF421 family)